MWEAITSLLFGVDWVRLFKPTQPLLETVLRGSITYLTGRSREDITKVKAAYVEGDGAVSILSKEQREIGTLHLHDL